MHGTLCCSDPQAKPPGTRAMVEAIGEPSGRGRAGGGADSGSALSDGNLVHIFGLGGGGGGGE